MSSFSASVHPPGRILVVGAGVSGLTTARILVDSGFDVVVLEARDFIGGRLHAKSVRLIPRYPHKRTNLTLTRARKCQRSHTGVRFSFGRYGG